MAVPSIKAAIFQFTADRLWALVASERLTRAELEKRLQPEDFEYLGKKLPASCWVPMGTLARVAQLLVELEHGELSDSVLRAQGERVAQRIHESGLYPQFDASAERWGANIGRISASLIAIAYNFMRWTYEPSDDGASARVLVEDASAFPEYSRIVSEGFIAYMMRVTTGTDAVVTSDRPTPDTIVYWIRSKRAAQ